MGNAPGRQQSKLTIQRAKFDGKTLSQVQEIFVGDSEGASGSRLTFGADGMLYAVIGAAAGDIAQHLDVTTGKVLRLRDDGTIPEDNPFVKRSDAKPRCSRMGIAIRWASLSIPMARCCRLNTAPTAAMNSTSSSQERTMAGRA